jgi:hypothetical protein
MPLCGKLAGVYRICGVRKHCKCVPTARRQPVRKHRWPTIVQPDCPALRAGRRSPTALRAAVPVCLNPGSRRSRCRIANQLLWLADGGLWSVDFLAWTSRSIAARQAEGKTSRGAGGRLRNAGQRAGAVHALAEWAAQPSTGGRGMDDSSSTTLVLGAAHSISENENAGYDSSDFSAAEHQSVLISNHAEIMSVSCPDRMSDKRGLGLFQAQQRHAKTWRVVPETDRAHTPQGSRRGATRGWSYPISNHAEI